MLASYLKQLRKNKIVSVPQALNQLGKGWSENAQGALEKEFTFGDYQQASNFLNRYTDHCAKLNFIPEWSNVYNKVSVHLYNSEFKALTTKEVELAQFLDRVSKQSLKIDLEEIMHFEKIVELAQLESKSLINEQTKPTSLFISEEVQSRKATIYLH